ncbi:Amino-acid acetyltransferase, mitochondrial [Entophlyctis luteolus]|nr:Amino-acid acetyltransferase, mitochondrial [Entophlyctis luteolus]
MAALKSTARPSPKSSDLQVLLQLQRSKLHQSRVDSKDKDVVLSILHANPSKREARIFASHFDRPVDNLTKAAPLLAVENIRLAIVRIEAGMSQKDLDSFARTLVAMRKLGQSAIVILDWESRISETHTHLASFVSVSSHRHSHHVSPTNREEFPSLALSASSRADMIAESNRIVEAIDNAGGRSVSVHGSLFVSSNSSREISCDSDLIKHHLSRRRIIVATSLCMNLDSVSNHEISTVESMTAVAGTVVTSLRNANPVKVYLMNSAGGFRGSDQHHIGLVNLAEEGVSVRNAISESNVVEDVELHRRKLRDFDLAEKVLQRLVHVSPCSSALVASVRGGADSRSALIANWITDKPPSSVRGGAVLSTPPTVLRIGLTLEVHRGSLDNVDLQKLESLLNDSFARKLNSKEYFLRLKTCVDTVIVAGDYDGAVVVTSEKIDGRVVHYLDKIGVRQGAQGLGIVDILWKRMVEFYPNLCWRSRTANPVNKWYFDRSDGNLKFGKDNYWMMFWYGNDGVTRLKDYQKVCGRIDASFM